jgi:hypothetical protein
MEDERTTHYATVRVELEDVTAEIAGKFWSSLHGREIDIGGYVAQVVQVGPDQSGGLP